MFEKMHWVCFHYEFDHGDAVDPDLACQVPSCPIRMIDRHPRRDWFAGRDDIER